MTANKPGSFRVERDSMGEMRVPADRYWGANTARSLENFSIGQDRMPSELVRAYAEIKKAAAIANHELGLLDAQRSEWIVQAAREVVEGKLDEHFPLSVWQTGSGTQTNMNLNEVIANRAIELSGGQLGSKDPIHPNDHVNLSQSSNDSFPSAMHIASATLLHARLLPAVGRLRDGLASKQELFADIVKIGRTHLQDAVPLTLGQEFSGYVAQLDSGLERIRSTLSGLEALALGGTAVGTGLNAPEGFAKRCTELLSEQTGLQLRPADNFFAELSAHDSMVMAHGALRVLACSLMKIANDLRWAGSGPRAGLGELQLPANEPGSSIMPGKINPTQCEAMTMVCTEVLGNDAAIGFAGSQGNFQLNVFKPLIAHNFIRSAVLLSDACDSLQRHAIEGLRANRERLERSVQASLMLVTALTPSLGYDAAAEIAKRADRDMLSLKEAAVALGYLSAEQFDALVDPMAMCKLGPPERD